MLDNLRRIEEKHRLEEIKKENEKSTLAKFPFQPRLISQERKRSSEQRSQSRKRTFDSFYQD